MRRVVYPNTIRGIHRWSAVSGAITSGVRLTVSTFLTIGCRLRLESPTLQEGRGVAMPRCEFPVYFPEATDLSQGQEYFFIEKDGKKGGCPVRC